MLTDLRPLRFDIDPHFDIAELGGHLAEVCMSALGHERTQLAVPVGVRFTPKSGR